MDDFAAALVLAMIRRGLAAQGIVVPGQAPGAAQAVPLAEKRALLAAVLARAGPLAILRVADIVPAFADHPVAGIFAGCRGAPDIVARWLAVERYFHSRHRTRITLGPDGRGIDMTHVDTRGGDIKPGEDLAVAGLVLGILRWRGATGLRLDIGGWRAFDGDYRPLPAALGPTCRWRFDWDGFEPRGPAGPLPEGALPAVDHAGRTLDDADVAALYAAILSAPGIPLPLAARARALRVSPRTLQRRLQAAGWTLQDIVASARVHLAARLLRESDTSLALVGLLAGYSDQPHFQRCFRKALGPTPAEFRRLG